MCTFVIVIGIIVPISIVILLITNKINQIDSHIHSKTSDYRLFRFQCSMQGYTELGIHMHAPIKL